MHEAGYKIVGVADIERGIFNARGLDLPALLEHVKEGADLNLFPGGQAIGSMEILEQAFTAVKTFRPLTRQQIVVLLAKTAKPARDGGRTRGRRGRCRSRWPQ